MQDFPDGLDAASAGWTAMPWPEQVSSDRSRVVILAIGDYFSVRRKIGLRRAAALAAWLAAAAQVVLPAAVVEIVARDRVELRIDGSSAFDLEGVLAQVEQLFRDESGLPWISLRGASAQPGADQDDIDALEVAEHLLVTATAAAVPLDQPIARPEGRALMSELPVALERGDLFVAYQPKLHLRQQEVAGLEALIRWQHPQHGLIPPGDFIPLAERTGDIGPLTIWTIRRVLEEQRIMNAAGHDVVVHINIAGRLLSDSAFVREACELLGTTGSRIGFEITETSVIRDPESAIANLKVFADIGVPIAIDDYGAGLSSLAYLKQLPARELKIDKLFITELTSSNRDPLIVRSTIDLAHALDMEVVAEGVESHATLALLTVMGCDMVQGYLISRPQPLDAIIAFLGLERSIPAQQMPIALGKIAGNWRSL